ncbi:MAG: PAS domain S-box protein [Candidatus Aminicenantes bacterium]|nr:MAG: PAS domain S-box protein [Candidatus Aminicenantes bacterium]
MENKDIKILVVEDEVITSENIKIVLENHGFTVLPLVTTGEEAVVKARETCPHLVLMDIMLAGEMDGIEAARSIREFTNIPIIYLTAYSDKQTLDRSKEAEPYGYILKPFNQYDLSYTVEMALFKHEADERLRREKEINALLANLSQELLKSPSIHDISHRVLAQAKLITNSRFGFVGYIDPKTGCLVSPAISRDIWDKSQPADQPIVFKKFSGLWGWVLKNKQTLLTNTPGKDPRSSGTPLGHLPISNFIGAPALIKNKLVGMVAVANNEDDYVEEDAVVIQQMAAVYALALQQKQAKDELEKYQDHLEELVKNRTIQLQNTNEKLKEEIIERKWAEKELQESRARYKNLFENSPVGIFKITPDGRILMANPAFVRMTGCSSFKELSKTVLNESWFSMNIPHSEFIEIMEQKKEIKGLEDQWRTADGREIFVRVNIRVGQDEQGKTIYYEGTVEDITEKKKAEEKAKFQEQQLLQADKMIALGTLVSGVAHEINNPNNFVMMNTPLIQQLWLGILPILEKYHEENGDFTVEGFNYTELRHTVPELFKGIMEGARRIKNIVKELKNFSRQESEEIEQSVDINTVVKSAVTLTSPMIRKFTNRFNVHYGQHIPTFPGKFQRLEQVIINLIQNSCQALPDKEKGILIVTGFEKETNQVVIKVTDEGIGIPSNDLKHITNPFFTTRRDSGGTGLGLSISSSIVTSHGGTVNFESTPGKGTMAAITLPVERK